MQDPAHNLNIALLIDADNSSIQWIEQIISELSLVGTIAIKHAYGNFSNPCMAPWPQVLQAHGIEQKNQDNISTFKNAADIKMVVEGMKILFYRPSVDVFCIVSSDCDFTPLVKFLRECCKEVIGYGRHHAATPYVETFTRYVYLDKPSPAVVPHQPAAALVAPSTPQEQAAKEGAVDGKISGSVLMQDTKLMDLLHGTIMKCVSYKGGWADLCDVGKLLVERSTFSPKDFGYKNLSQFLAAIDRFQVRKIPFTPTLVRIRT